MTQIGRFAQAVATSPVVVLAVLGVCLVASRDAHAQPASVEQHTEKSSQETPAEDATTLAASLGGTLNTGNTRSWQVTLGSDLLVVRSPHALTAMVAVAYGQADLPDDGVDDFEDTVGNLRARAR